MYGNHRKLISMYFWDIFPWDYQFMFYECWSHLSWTIFNYEPSGEKRHNCLFRNIHKKSLTELMFYLEWKKSRAMYLQYYLVYLVILFGLNNARNVNYTEISETRLSGKLNRRIVHCNEEFELLPTTRKYFFKII